jgi:hypothetical protein
MWIFPFWEEYKPASEYKYPEKLKHKPFLS